MLKAITKKEYAAICWPNDEGMQKYIESETFEVVPLNDGYTTIEKARIKKDFCFGYGMYGTATDEECRAASRCAESAKKWEQFRAENVRDVLKRIETLEAALNCDDSGMFETFNRLAVIGICEHYYKTPLSRAWEVLDSTNCLGLITPEKIIEGANVNRRAKYRLSTKEEIKELLAAEKRQLENFEKRLATYWKRYGADKLNIWTYIVD